MKANETTPGLIHLGTTIAFIVARSGAGLQQHSREPRNRASKTDS
jgi:hypothetical protein